MDTPNRRTTSAHAAHVPARLQATWAELVRRLGVSNFEKNYIFGILMKNCTKYLSASSIGRISFKVGTPTVAMHGWNSDLINRYVVLLCIIKHLSQRIFGRIWCKGNQIQRRIGNERRISFGFWPDSQECLHRTLLIVPSHSFVHSNAKFDEYNLTI